MVFMVVVQIGQAPIGISFTVSLERPHGVISLHIFGMELQRWNLAICF